MTLTSLSRRPSDADRREAVSKRLAVASDAIGRLEAVLNAAPSGAEREALRGSLRALIAVGCHDPGFDVRICAGSHPSWALRLFREGAEVQAEWVPLPAPAAAPASPAPPWVRSEPPTAPLPLGPIIPIGPQALPPTAERAMPVGSFVGELAALLWSRDFSQGAEQEVGQQ